MDRRSALTFAGATALGLVSWNHTWSSQEPKRKLLFFTKSSGFEHPACQRHGKELAYNEQVMQRLGKQNSFDVECSKDGSVFDSNLDRFDAFFFYTTGDLTQVGTDGHPAMSPRGKERLLAAVAAGKGFLASHCGSDTFPSGPSNEVQDPPDPYIAMLGGEFIGHGPEQEARQYVASQMFPGLNGLGRWLDLHEEWYSLKNFADDLHVILALDTLGMEGKEYQRPPYPSTWARQHGKGRVFYTSMGHREEIWDHPAFQQILMGGLKWAFGDVEVEIPPNMAEITPGARVMPPV